ncbi:MAG: sulfatase-like hydrolase/transferase [Pleurocapsa sp. MO_226.B13]|nr:sulfatase-like hydrolase/transferase [Pleurocapsa sp. MO_226.B13]
MRLFVYLLFLIIFLPAKAFAQTPERVLMLFIDGLHPRAINHFDLKNIKRVMENGTYAEKGVMMYPAHPTLGDYGDWHTTSFPNIAGQAGTVFFEKQPRFLQHVMGQQGKTLHAAGSRSYRTMNEGFDYTFTSSGGTTDQQVVDFYINAIEQQGDIVYARLMLQETGNAGRIESAKNTSDDPWANDVFHEQSPYGQTVKQADEQIGRLLDYLEDRGKLDTTLITIGGDGQAIGGWHQTLDENAALTPVIFKGPGIPQGRTIPYAENIDVAPTIASLMGVNPPNQDGGTGLILFGSNAHTNAHPRYLETINQQIRDYRKLHAQAVLRAFEDPKMNVLLMELKHGLLSEHQFYTPERVMEWHKSEDLSSMIESNAWVLETLRLALEENKYRFGAY